MDKTPSKVDQEYELSETRKAIQRAERAAAIEEKARLTEEEAVFKRIFLEDELEDAYHSIDMTHEDIAKIEGRLKNAKEEEEKAGKTYKEAQRKSKTYEKMIDMSSAKRNKMLARMGDDIVVPITDDERVDEEMDIASIKTEDFQQETYNENAQKEERPSIRAYDIKTNVLRFPPTNPCELAYDDVDEFSGKKRKQTKKTFFFAHTPDRFRSYFKGRDYLVCKGTLIDSAIYRWR